jgi:thiol:disulfide interchange protein
MKKKEEGLFGSFSSGILATVVATPCTGPMLGTVIGFAATLSPFASMLIFTVLGTGMAAPYLLLAFFPKLMRFLPKPGAWMDTFRELMGFMMLATVLWLLWVFSAQTESNGLILVIGGLFCLSLGCWIYGKWGSPVKDMLTRIIGIILALGCFVIGGYVITLASKVTAVERSEDQIAMADKPGKVTAQWEKYSPERVKELQRQGVPVFIDFTAKWCLICQANHLAFSTSEVEAKFVELGVVKMKADWTRNDPIITEELRKQGRNGVPLYLLFDGDEAKAPQILPQVLTPAIMMEYLASIEK